MIPSSLKLHNFTAYGSNSTELNFRSLQLVVLSGPNGAGKSSILDAMTWAIWGWSRAGDNADKLVRLGQKEMWVEFIFELDGTEYKIVRTRKVGAVGTTTLQFFANEKTNLTEGTIKATQEKIVQTLHLTYETFVNSSYLRQNRADEFTIKSPNDRKEVLADILGLYLYDELEEKAKRQVSAAEEKIATLDIQLAELGLELESGAGHQEAKDKSEEELLKIQARLISAEKNLAEIQSLRETALSKFESAKVSADRVYKLQVEIERLEKELEDLRQQIRGLKELAEQKAVIESGYTKLTKIRAELRKLDVTRDTLVKIKDGALAVERKVSLNELEKERSLSEIKSEGGALAEELKKDGAELARVKENKRKCPTCGQEIGADEHQKIITTLTIAISERKRQIDSLRLRYAKVKAVETPGHTELVKLQKEIVKLESEVKPAESLQKETDELAQFEDKKRDLEVAAAKIEAATTSGKKMKEQQESLKIELAKEKSIDLMSLQEEISKLDEERREKDLLLRTIRQEEISIRETLAEVKQLVSRAVQVEKMVGDKRDERNEAGIRKTDYEDLAAAFGKRGIQAMLIESAIPEIEDEANSLLEKMTDGRMKVELPTQRETKTSGITETLDIVISDELGARPYEMYSGGEAFRINLAIRLALSRLLTHRAGAKLQFLIIDEGFGTQDVQGKYKIVEAINSIREDFAKILVVTHDPELKEAFPQRIEVSRNIAGSTFEVFV